MVNSRVPEHDNQEDDGRQAWVSGISGKTEDSENEKNSTCLERGKIYGYVDVDFNCQRFYSFKVWVTLKRNVRI